MFNIEKFRLFLKNEWFLISLVLLYILLTITDPSLPSRSLWLIDYKSLTAILSFFIISRGLELSGIFVRVARGLLKLSGNSEFRLLSITALVVSLSSALIMNDTAIFVFIPFIITLSRITEIDFPKSVVLITLAANVGSGLTPFGNPQNIIIWKNYNLTVLEFVISMCPYVFLWVALLLVIIGMTSAKRLNIIETPKIKIKGGLVMLSLFLLLVNILLVERGFSYFGFILTFVFMLLFAKEALLSIDVAIIAIFALIFIDFKELSHLLPISSIRLSDAAILTFSAILSQIVSNVPATVMLTSAGLPWLPIAVGVNIGGTGLITGSLANIISIRLSGISLRDFHKYTIPYFLSALLATITFLRVLHVI